MIRAPLVIVIALALIGASACSFEPDGPDSGGTCDDWTFAPINFDACAINDSQVGNELVLSKPGIYELDTDQDSLKDPDGMTVPITQQHRKQGADQPEIELILTDRLEIASGTTLRAEGNRSLLIASWGDIVIDGAIDVSSTTMGTKPGAGSDPQACATNPARNGQDGTEGGGGGGGGGLGRMGGSGGSTTNPTAGVGGSGGMAITEFTILRGGCAGAKGGKDVDENDGAGQGGQGGGAVGLVARQKMIIPGTINAGGEGGEGGRGDSGRNSSGGGGGGSGGLIQLEAASITLQVSTILAANGGGGGGGSGGNVGMDGTDGLLDKAAAGGGPGEGGRGDGGVGGFADQSDGQSGESDPDRGGGGGGGGVGFLILRTLTAVNPPVESKLSPDPKSELAKSAR